MGQGRSKVIELASLNKIVICDYRPLSDKGPIGTGQVLITFNKLCVHAKRVKLTAETVSRLEFCSFHGQNPNLDHSK